MHLLEYSVLAVGDGLALVYSQSIVISHSSAVLMEYDLFSVVL